MRALLKRIYELIAAPLYDRLSRDVTIHTQTALAENLEYQERTTQKLLDEMARFHLELERLKAQSDQDLISPPSGRTEEEMEKLVNKANSHLELVQLASEQQIPLTELFEWKSRYGGMGTQVMRRMRRLERENQHLRSENQFFRKNLSAPIKNIEDLDKAGKNAFGGEGNL